MRQFPNSVEMVWQQDECNIVKWTFMLNSSDRIPQARSPQIRRKNPSSLVGDNRKKIRVPLTRSPIIARAIRLNHSVVRHDSTLLHLFNKLDQWIRRRIRMCYWKQWRRPKRRREMLIRLGVPRRQAIRHARSRQSYWHMSKTIASGVGLTNAWLAEQGLPSLKTLWAKLAHLR